MQKYEVILVINEETHQLVGASLKSLSAQALSILDPYLGAHATLAKKHLKAGRFFFRLGTSPRFECSLTAI